MPTSFATRKYLTETITAMSKIGAEAGINFHYALVDVKGSGDIEPIGTPVVWDDTDAFEVYVDQDITALTTNSTLPNASPIGVTVGTYEYIGSNEADVTLSATATKMWVLFRGEGGVKEEGIEWDAGSSAGDKTAFRVLLEKANLAVVTQQTLATPAY